MKNIVKGKEQKKIQVNEVKFSYQRNTKISEVTLMTELYFLRKHVNLGKDKRQ